MVHLEAGQTMEELSLSDEVKDGTVLQIETESSSSNESKGARNVNNRGRSKGWRIDDPSCVEKKRVQYTSCLINIV